MLVGFVALRLVWALGEGPEVFNETLASFGNPLYVAFHVVTFVSVLLVGVRFFRLFPKAQPPVIGPLKPPPAPVILGGLYGAWIAVAVLFSLILSGVLF